MKLNLAWFNGFAPAHAPRVVVSVLIEGVIPQDQVQGGLTATPIARDLLAAYFSKYPVSSLLPQSPNLKIPNFLW